MMWKEAPDSKYHALPIIVLVMHVIRVKSSSNYEDKDSLDAPPEIIFLAFLYDHFMAYLSNSL